MRGARQAVVQGQHPPGIIPADAGSTGSICLKESMNEDHPRGCGEHALTHSTSIVPAGSSPRMRGARLLSLMVVFTIGIIPADTGNTRLQRS